MKQASYTELFSVTKNAGSKYARSRNVWNTVSRIHLNQYVTKWAYDTAVKYFPNINVNDYQSADTATWLKMTRVAGFSDRKPLVSTMDWNSQYILSGMYANGRNIWRITPNTNAITMGEFLVDKEVPTFYVDGKTVTFPGGKIIEDSTISIVGSSGYWVETAKDVVPVVTTEAEHYEFYPSFLYDFEEYASGAFDYNTSKPKNAWGFTWSAAGDVKGQSNILNIDGNNKLAIIGNSKNWVKELPTNVTAGDSFAEDQTWELTVTVPEGLSADAQIDILTYNGNKQDLTDGGFMIKGYKLYYATGKHDANYTFYAAQLFTTDDYSKQIGSVEIANVANTAEGIQFEVYGVSPIAIGWIAPEEVEVDDGLIPMPPTDSRPAPTAVKVQRPTEAPETEETEEPTEETEYIEDTEPTEEPTEAPTETTAPAVVEDEGGVNIWLIVVIAVVVLAGAGAAVFFLLKKKKVAAPAAEEIEDIEESAEEKTEE
ncbi:MAG: DUF4366 domain-containing protein [Oscillospiraceae bacterium]|nr:DUF4366 domain-containing protein [Oscillospiraceae bacterium]